MCTFGRDSKTGLMNTTFYSAEDGGHFHVYGSAESHHTVQCMFIPDLPGPGVAPDDWPEHGTTPDFIMLTNERPLLGLGLTVVGDCDPNFDRWAVPS